MKLGRRRFLKGLGGALVGLPILSALEPRRARAQAMPTGPKRAVFFWTPNGFNVSTFYPRTRFNGGASAFGPLTADSFAARTLDTGSADTVNGVPRSLFRHPEWCLKNLGAFASRLSILRGFRNSRDGFVNLADGGDHGMETANRLTAAGIGSGQGLALGRSVDYAIADRINPTVGGTRVPLVLHVGQNADPTNGNGTSFISYSAAQQPDPGINNPWVAFRQLMNIAPGSTAETYLVQRKLRIADLVKSELTDFQSSITLGGRDTAFVNQWLGLVEATEDTLRGTGMMVSAPSCTAATRDATLPAASIQSFQTADNNALGDYSNFAAIGDAMIKIVALSLLCGSTNVATIQWSSGAGGPAFGAMGMGSDPTGSWYPGDRHHELSHRNGSDGGDPGFLTDVERNMSWIDNWYGDRYRDLLQLLDGFGLLDDSLVTWFPEFGDGRQHHFIEITAVVAGSAGGYLKTGAMVDCSATGQWDSRLDSETNGPKIVANSNPTNVYDLDVGWIDGCTSHNKLLTTIFNAVLPRDTSGQPMNPIARFPETDTADTDNHLESGELSAIKA
jgi:hypothetical protein